MASMLNQIYPYSQKSSYRPGDIIDFVMTLPGQGLVLNSIKLSGNIVPTDVAGDILYDSVCGIHSFMNNFMCSTTNQGVLENKSNYCRYVKMKRTASKAVGDIVTDIKMTPELTCPSDAKTNIVLSSGASIPFSMIPEVCFNNASSGGQVPVLNWSQTGDIKLSFRLVQPTECFFGSQAAGASYTLTDLRCDFITVPAVAKPAPINMLVVNEVKQILNSSVAMISANLPVSIYSMSASFLPVSKELNSLYNNVGLENPTVSRLVFQFNDSTNQYIGFNIDTQEDMLEHYLESFPENTMGKNDFTLEKIMKGDRFGVGIGFSDAVSLANNFGINLSSLASDSNQYYVYMFFRSYLQM